MGICSAGGCLIESLHLLSSKLNFAIRSQRLLFQMNVPKTPISFFIFHRTLLMSFANQQNTFAKTELTQKSENKEVKAQV